MIENASKKKIAVFDLTDCEGCELQFLSNEGKIELLLDKYEFVDFRLLGTSSDSLIDVSLIEGTPLTKNDIEFILDIRKRSKIVIAFGTCAATGGIAAGIGEVERKNFAKKIYHSKYINQVKLAQPLSSYIKVDFIISGCPVDPALLFNMLMNLDNLNSIEDYNYPVCQECKAKGNLCLLKKNQICFGPIIKAGCGAPCPTAGYGCLGCLGILKDSNLKQFKLKLKTIGLSEERIKQLYNVFLRNTHE